MGLSGLITGKAARLLSGRTLHSMKEAGIGSGFIFGPAEDFEEWP